MNSKRREKRKNAREKVKKSKINRDIRKTFEDQKKKRRIKNDEEMSI